MSLEVGEEIVREVEESSVVKRSRKLTKMI